MIASIVFETWNMQCVFVDDDLIIELTPVLLTLQLNLFSSFICMWAEFLNAEERLVREEFYRIEVEIEVRWPKKDTKEDRSPDSKPDEPPKADDP